MMMLKVSLQSSIAHLSLNFMAFCWQRKPSASAGDLQGGLVLKIARK
jgi:hypothetical protein